jgi:hypothetical protein
MQKPNQFCGQNKTGESITEDCQFMPWLTGSSTTVTLTTQQHDNAKTDTLMAPLVHRLVCSHTATMLQQQVVV